MTNVFEEYLSDKIRATTAVVKGQISTKVTRRTPYTMKLFNLDFLPDRVEMWVESILLKLA